MLRNREQTLTHDIVTDKQGWFHAAHLPPGQYIIGKTNSADARRSSVYEVSLATGENKTVEIPFDRHLTDQEDDGYMVVTLVTEQGIPLATSDVWLESHGIIVEPHFNSDDSKSFRGKPGTYNIYAEYPGFKTVRVPVEMLSKHGRSTQEILKPVVITMKRE